MMTNVQHFSIRFARLYDVAPDLILKHMSDPIVAKHMPLLTFSWDLQTVQNFVAEKEACWRRDGLGHWAFLKNGVYVGWGGFQKEGSEWDFGLVLKPEFFGIGVHIAKQAIAFANADARIPFVTFLLAPTRTHTRALQRFGATYLGEIEYESTIFLKFRIDTP